MINDNEGYKKVMAELIAYLADTLIDLHSESKKYRDSKAVGDIVELSVIFQKIKLLSEIGKKTQALMAGMVDDLTRVKPKTDNFGAN